jgi:hypothetical protein
MQNMKVRKATFDMEKFMMKASKRDFPNSNVNIERVFTPRKKNIIGSKMTPILNKSVRKKI